MEQIIEEPAVLDSSVLSKLCSEIVYDAGRLEEERDREYAGMEEKSYLLMKLYNRLRERVGISPHSIALESKQSAVEWQYRTAIRIMFEFECEVKPRFNYDAVIDEFLRLNKEEGKRSSGKG